MVGCPPSEIFLIFFSASPRSLKTKSATALAKASLCDIPDCIFFVYSPAAAAIALSSVALKTPPATAPPAAPANKAVFTSSPKSAALTPCVTELPKVFCIIGSFSLDKAATYSPAW